MTIKFSIKFLFAFVLLFSCNQKDSSKEEYIKTLEKENENYKNRIVEDSLKQISHSTIPNTPITSSISPNISTSQIEEKPKTLSPYEMKQIAIAKTIKSYAQFLRKYFGKGSYPNEVSQVQGSPDDVVNTDSKTEVWFYGDCEVTFTDGKVSKVINQEKCLQYLDCNLLIDHWDWDVRKIGYMIVFRKMPPSQ